MPNDIYNSFDLALTKPPLFGDTVQSVNSFSQGIAMQTIQSGDMAVNANLVNGYLQSSNFVTGSAGWQIDAEGDAEFNSGTFRGALAAATIDIGGTDATSWHVDIDGNMWWGSAGSYASASVKISNAGLINLGAKMSLDGPNERQIINDGTNDRVLIGKYTGLF